MPMIEMPATPVAAAEVVIERRVGEAGNRGPSPVSANSLYGTVGACIPVFKEVTSKVSGVLLNGTKTLNPGNAALNIFLHKQEIDLYDSQVVQEEAGHTNKTTLVNPPKHGQIVWRGGNEYNAINGGNEDTYVYEPSDGYLGSDRVTFMTDLAGHRIKVVYYLRVIDKTLELEKWDKIYNQYCPRKTWLISGETKNDLVNWAQPPIDQLASRFSLHHVRNLY